VNSSATVIALVPEELSTLTSTVLDAVLPAGAVAVIDVEELTVKPAATGRCQPERPVVSFP